MKTNPTMTPKLKSYRTSSRLNLTERIIIILITILILILDVKFVFPQVFSIENLRIQLNYLSISLQNSWGVQVFELSQNGQQQASWELYLETLLQILNLAN
jgi:hypothetical protein